MRVSGPTNLKQPLSRQSACNSLTLRAEVIANKKTVLSVTCFKSARSNGSHGGRERASYTGCSDQCGIVTGDGKRRFAPAKNRVIDDNLPTRMPLTPEWKAEMAEGINT